jgi:predicted O-linked N-acetylglucosamine transferase (SPINDLY family)
MGEVSELPLAKSGLVRFLTLTRAIRVNYRVIKAWAEILKRVPKSTLVVDSRNFQSIEMQDRLRLQFSSLGIGPDRLEIGYHSPPWELMRCADVTLDCFPHNSGTTLFESLYMGLPVITLQSRPGVGRLGASILRSLGRAEWIATNDIEYIEKAVRLVSDCRELAGIRSTLRAEMEASVLMDERGFAKRVETAYFNMRDNAR